MITSRSRYNFLSFFIWSVSVFLTLATYMYCIQFKQSSYPQNKPGRGASGWLSALCIGDESSNNQPGVISHHRSLLCVTSVPCYSALPRPVAIKWASVNKQHRGRAQLQADQSGDKKGFCALPNLFSLCVLVPWLDIPDKLSWPHLVRSKVIMTETRDRNSLQRYNYKLDQKIQTGLNHLRAPYWSVEHCQVFLLAEVTEGTRWPGNKASYVVNNQHKNESLLLQTMTMTQVERHLK